LFSFMFRLLVFQIPKVTGFTVVPADSFFLACQKKNVMDSAGAIRPLSMHGAPERNQGGSPTRPSQPTLTIRKRHELLLGLDVSAYLP
jgi:hypothetical protein